MTSNARSKIDQAMSRVSQDLGEGRYLAAAAGARRALALARRAGDFERMARICMPLIESHRMIRQHALDLGPATIVATGTDAPEPPCDGCYLFAPMLVGADARAYRAHAADLGAGAFVLTREPETSKGLWPVVGVGERVVRIRTAPPKDPSVIDPEWFAKAHEDLGDQAVLDAKDDFEPGDPSAWYVDDLLDRIDAVPEHEKFHMELERACRDAMAQPVPTIKRRRALIKDPYSF